MSRSKRVRKKYNPDKGRQRYMDHFANKLVLESWDGDQVEGQPACFTCNQPNHILDYAVTTPKRWYVEVIARFETADGDRYEWTNEIASEPVRVNELADFALEKLADAEASGNPNHLVDRGWRARILTPALARELEAA